MRIHVLALLAISASTAQAAPLLALRQQASLPIVDLGYSRVQAVSGNSSTGYYKYQNIRFAKAPIGELRWAAPQWPDDETAVNNGSLGAASVACSSSEDCLFADVYVPVNATKALPVMVWTYGGKRFAYYITTPKLIHVQVASQAEARTRTDPKAYSTLAKTSSSSPIIIAWAQRALSMDQLSLTKAAHLTSVSMMLSTHSCGSSGTSAILEAIQRKSPPSASRRVPAKFCSR